MHAPATAATDRWLEIVRRKAAAMRFGSVHITIHDGRVTQVESTEKTRLPADPGAADPGAQPEEN
jgi:hypothetical protein